MLPRCWNVALDNETDSVLYSGNGSNTLPYFINFKFLEDGEHIGVKVTGSDNIPHTLAPTHYTVHDVEEAAPYVTTAIAYPNTTDVFIYRTVPYTQPLVVPNAGRLPSTALEKGYDRLTMLVQQLLTKFNDIFTRSFRSQQYVGDTGTNVFPTPRQGVLGYTESSAADILSAADLALFLEGTAFSVPAGDLVISALGARVDILEDKSGSFTGGGVILKIAGQSDQHINPVSDDNNSRGNALRNACIFAANEPTKACIIELKPGGYSVNVGEPLTLYATEPNVTVCFQEGAWLEYLDEVDAGSDWELFPGTIRRAEWFGVHEDLADVQPRLQAAFFSMPPTYDPVAPNADYPGIATRKGRVILQNSETPYNLGKTLWLTSHQQLYGEGGRPSVLSAVAGMATGAGADVPMICTVKYLFGGVPTTNFCFDIHVVDIALQNNHVGNTRLTGLRYGCAQGGLLDLTVNSMGYISVDVMDQSGLFEIRRLWALDILGIQSGPHLRMRYTASVVFGMISVELLNNHTAASGLRKTFAMDSYTGNLAAIMLEYCNNLEIPVINAEHCSSVLVMSGCRQSRVGGVDISRSNGTGIGECCVRMIYCDNSRIGHVEGTNFDTLLYVFQTGFEYSRAGSAGLALAYGVDTAVVIADAFVAALYMRRQNLDYVEPSGGIYKWSVGGPSYDSACSLIGGLGYALAKFNHGTSDAGYSCILDAGGLWGLLVPSKIKAGKGFAVISGAADPTTTDIPDGLRQTWRNTTSGEVRDWTNVGGTMKKSAAYT